jgi:hypothetical protein
MKATRPAFPISGLFLEGVTMKCKRRVSVMRAVSTRQGGAAIPILARDDV